MRRSRVASLSGRISSHDPLSRWSASCMRACTWVRNCMAVGLCGGRSWNSNSADRSLRYAGRHCSIHRASRSEEHTSELQSRGHLVCSLLLEKKKIYSIIHDENLAIHHIAILIIKNNYKNLIYISVSEYEFEVDKSKIEGLFVLLKINDIVHR